MKQKLIRYLLDRLKEPTSLVGYVLALGSVAGWHLNPEVVTAWVTLGGAVAGLVLYLYPEAAKDA